jgi:hypothetical protein
MVGKPGRSGGARPNSGPKPLPRAPLIDIAVERLLADAVRASEDAVGLARGYTGLAIEVLVVIAAQGASEIARVQAAKALLERGHGKVGRPETAPQTGRRPVNPWDGLLPNDRRN